MTTREQFNEILPKVSFNTQAITSDTTTVGNIIDTQGFSSATFSGQSGTLTDGTFTRLIEEGDAANLSDAAAVADQDLTTTEADASFVAADDDAIKRIGYTGSKRFIRESWVSTGTTSGGTISGQILLGIPNTSPVDGN